MKVAGLGFRRDAGVASLRDALDAAGGSDGLAAIATVSDKADAAALRDLARELGVAGPEHSRRDPG
ncbi:cobalamin biosynthesis protein CbiG [Bradyrhizobium elkanii]|uniref:cobalamin biosynthesis protein n=1 Tax=Bradyrhizobium elkanii TaxID=29448 RepID=UPI003834B49F